MNKKEEQKQVNAPEKLRIGVVGVGSIGTTIALLLSQAGYDVEITKKSPNALRIDNCINLEINGKFGDRSQLVACVENNNFSSEKDVIIMCTRSYSTAGALKEIKKFLKPTGVVISLQNVLNYEQVLKVIPASKYIGMVIDWTATRVNTNHVSVLTDGEIHIGAFNKKASSILPIIEKLLSCVSPVKVEENFLDFVISRFILNCTISSLIAITGHPLKETLQHKKAREMMIGLMREMMHVFNAYDINILDYREMFNYHKFVKRGLLGNAYRYKIFSRLSKKYSEMSSSVLRNLERGEKTELDSLCNRVVEMAEKKGIQVPFNSAVATFLSDVENGNQSIFMENLQSQYFNNLKINWRLKLWL